MAELETYRNTKPYGFCPGCSHRLVLDALDRVLTRLQWDPAETVIVTAQMVAPYAAGWLYASDPTYPFVASLALIPIAVLIVLVGSRW